MMHSECDRDTATCGVSMHACICAYYAFTSYVCHHVQTFQMQVRGIYLGVLLSDCAGTAGIEESAE